MSGDEKRRHRRIPAAFAVIYSVKEPLEVRSDFGEKERDGLASDLSEGGLSLFSDYPLPMGAVISLKFRLTSDSDGTAEESSRKMDLLAQVHHAASAKEKATCITGVRFLRLSEKDRAFIAACAEVK